MTTASNEAHNSAIWVLTEAMGMQPDTRALILHDDATLDLAMCIRAAGATSQIDIDMLHVPTADQERYSQHQTAILPMKLRERLVKFRRLIFLQRWSQATTRFRVLVLGFIDQDPARCAASMPGITLALLPSVCGGDLTMLEQRCRLVADRLLWSRNAYIHTTGPGDRPHVLTVPIGKYSPITSSGRIRRSWGNVPSGESFIVPNTEEAHGSIAIDGSLPNHPINNAPPLELTFIRGRAQPVPDVHPSHLSVYNTLLFTPAGDEVARNCSCLAELGIGLNPRITTITGNPILDEKIEGTLHIGLGSNDQFDGPIPCTMHNDMVAQRVTLFLDDTRVIDNGRFVLTHADTFPHWSQVKCGDMSMSSQVRRLGTPLTPMDKPVYADREWTSPRSKDRDNPFAHTRIGDDETSRLAYKVVTFLEEFPSQQATVAQLLDACANFVPSKALFPIIDLLHRFRIIDRH